MRAIQVLLILIFSIKTIFAQWTPSGSNLFCNNQNVGIQDITPSASLVVNSYGNPSMNISSSANSHMQFGLSQNLSWMYSPVATDGDASITRRNDTNILGDLIIGTSLSSSNNVSGGANGAIRLTTSSSGLPGDLERLTILNNGKILIGTQQTTQALDGLVYVNGKMYTKSLKTSLAYSGQFPDYVFNYDYKLLSITKLKQFILKENHLPNIRSDKEVKDDNGIEVSTFTTQLLQKIEELTLYLISLERVNENLESEILKAESKSY